jgi:uncharacterized protein YjbJ (UPF0337 family)
MNRDELKGRMREVKGKAKQAAGDLTDDERLRRRGLDEEARGKAQAEIGRARRKIGETIESAGKRMKR